MQQLLEKNSRLRRVFEQAPPAERWLLPFPLAVFGTLRARCRNAHLMGRDPEGRLANEEKYRRAAEIHYRHRGRHKGFLADFLAIDLELFHRAEAAAPVEVYDYEPEDWREMIVPVDRLEGFSPTAVVRQGYHRTLVEIRLLPEEFEHPLFELGDPLSVATRDLALPREEWEKFPPVACWVYTSHEENRKARETEAHPLLWWGE